MATAAYARSAGIEYLIVGIPMDFWQTHMPDGMLLRSGCDWHLDPLNLHTIEAFLQARGLVPGDVEPLSIELYREYASWFQRAKRLEPIPQLVRRLDWTPDGADHFSARLEDGRTVAARDVVVAIGFEYFKNLPDDLVALLPQGRYSHTCDLVDFEALAGRTCLIIGGRQSAFEWAALIAEAGAAAVHICHRHETPRFTESDWRWVDPLLERIEREPDWFRGLSSPEREVIDRRFWVEGRLKLEPWLHPRIQGAPVTLWSNSHVVACRTTPDGYLLVSLDGGQTLTVDHVILATGYDVDVARVPFLAAGNTLDNLESRDGHPVLSGEFQSSLPGLYITSMMATRDHGSFLAFTVSVRASARMIVRAIARTRRSLPPSAEQTKEP